MSQACHTTEHAQLSIQLSFSPHMEKISLLQFPVVSGLEMKIVQSIEKDLSPCHAPTLKLVFTFDVCMHDSNSLSNECHSMASPLVG